MSSSRALRHSLVTALSCAVLLHLPASSTAQTACDSAIERHTLRVGIGGGFVQSPPMNRLGVADVGYAATASLESGTPVRFLRVRAEGLYAHWGPDTRHMIALTASVIASPRVRWTAVPYVLAGAGGVAVPTEGRARAWTLGMGLRFPGQRRTFFLETRTLAFDIGEAGLLRSGIPVGTAQYNRWQYTAAPLVLGVQF